MTLLTTNFDFMNHADIVNQGKNVWGNNLWALVACNNKNGIDIYIKVSHVLLCIWTAKRAIARIYM